MGLITEPDVQSFPVRLGKHHDRGDAEIPTGPNDPDRDLPPIGDENFLNKFKTWNLEPETWNAREARSYSGIFPCFLGGLVSRLLAVISRARINFVRV